MILDAVYFLVFLIAAAAIIYRFFKNGKFRNTRCEKCDNSVSIYEVGSVSDEEYKKHTLLYRIFNSKNEIKKVQCNHCGHIQVFTENT